MDFEEGRFLNLINLFSECQHPDFVKNAQSKLAEYEKEPLFYTNLLNLFQNQTIGEIHK